MEKRKLNSAEDNKSLRVEMKRRIKTCDESMGAYREFCEIILKGLEREWAQIKRLERKNKREGKVAL